MKYKRPSSDEEEKEKKIQFRSLFAGDENAARGIFQCSFCHRNHPSYANRNWVDLRWDLAKDFCPSDFFPSCCSSLLPANASVVF
ncbi:hypothetical protein CEXT_421171 [Caerostris extrusa]|uniref:Uncharacterized protein n=1 Tax=Caerostris extrusa TaxID=172846 RepID=A0AAV4Y075_CAEEX|nr:hypothetical protein CEXT_421171 [Caerostris extrusa]